MPHCKDISDGTIEALNASVLDAVVVVDAAGDIVAWNCLATGLFGWTADEAICQSLGALIVPPQHRHGHQRGMARYAE